MLDRERGSAPAVQPPSYSPDAQPLLQALLATLADLDLEYERERNRISNGTTDPELKSRALRKLDDKHRERREPYIRHLTATQERAIR